MYMAPRSFVLVYTVLLGVALAATPYSPSSIECPPSALVRLANGISDKESSWISQRDVIAQEALKSWLEESKLTDFNVTDFFTKNTTGPSTVRIGLAFSGGGYRAMLSGAGMLAAIDDRTKGAREEGGLGGLLQAASYVTGLSGGAWLVGSVAMNNFMTVPSLQASKELWNFEDVFNPTPTHTGFLGHIQIGWTVQVVEDVLGKQSSGYPISLTDAWGRYLSAQTIGGTNHGQSMLWSDLTRMDAIRNHQMPLPIIVFDGTVDNFVDNVSLNSTIYEASPFDFGSWDPTVYSFVDTKYLGSLLSKGTPGPNNKCVVGYDNAGFLIGASSTLFDQFVQAALQTSSLLRTLFTDIMKGLNVYDIGMAIIGSNPFADLEYVWEPIKTSNTLKLVDGGEDGQNVPFSPLLQPDREVDVILTFDNSADDLHNWPMGEALIDTYERQFSSQGNGTSFPYVPTTDSFITLGLVEEPVFFGCFPRDKNQHTPLVVYFANSKHSYSSNFSTFKLSYNSTERDNMITNGYNIVTQNNGTLDSDWRQCVACSLILREQQRRSMPISQQCRKCFSRYCYEDIALRAGNHQSSIYKSSADSKSRTKNQNSSLNYSQRSCRQRRDAQTNVIHTAQNLTTDAEGMYEQVV